MRKAAGFIALSLLLLDAGPTRATILLSMTTDQLLEQSRTIVRGRVVKQEVVTIEGRLWTDSHLLVAESIKGAVRGRTVIIRQPGGETARIGMRVAGAARFRPGEEALVFLAPLTAPDHYLPVGMCQGKFEIYQDRRGLRRVRRDLQGASFAHRDDQGRVTILPAVRVVGPDEELSGLLRRLRQRLTASGSGGAR